MTASVAQQVSQLIQTWNQREAQLRDWLGGSADGGPNNDGRYPLVDALGRETLVPSPATFANMVEGPAALAEAAMANAGVYADAADLSAQTATTKADLAAAHEIAAITARNLAEQHRSFAGNHEANARYWAELAEGIGANATAERIVVEQLHGEVVQAASESEIAATEAAESAVLAATFNPAHFDRKTDSLHADRIIGVLAPDRIPVLPSQLQFASSGDLTDLTQQQQDDIGQGSIVTTTDGYRRVYSGAGSKIDPASYTTLADLTPEWTSITGKPPSYPSTEHNHAWGEITEAPAWVGRLSASGNWLRHTTTHGYIDFGPNNANWAHIYTDRPEFYFNKPIRVNNVAVSLDGHAHPDLLATAGGAMSGPIAFGSSAGAKLNLYSTTYALGIQSNTLYARTATNFCVHQGGVHSDTAATPGTGGTMILQVTNALLYTPGQVRVGNGTAALPAYSFNGDTDNGMYRPNTNQIAFSTAGVQRLIINATGAATFAAAVTMPSWTVTSDRRLKTDIRPLEGFADLIDSTAVYSFVKDGLRQFGVIADEAQKVRPEMVMAMPGQEDEADPILTVNPMDYVYALIAEAKSLRARVAALEGRQ